MKQLEKKNYSYKELQETIRSHIDEILSRYPDLDESKIEEVGILENGKLQLKVPDTFKNRQVILLIGYLKWLARIK